MIIPMFCNGWAVIASNPSKLANTSTGNDQIACVLTVRPEQPHDLSDAGALPRIRRKQRRPPAQRRLVLDTATPTASHQSNASPLTKTVRQQKAAVRNVLTHYSKIAAACDSSLVPSPVPITSAGTRPSGEIVLYSIRPLPSSASTM